MRLRKVNPKIMSRAPRFSLIAGELNARLRGRVLVGHHVPYDRACLRDEYRRLSQELPDMPILCTYRVSHHYLPGLDRRRLEDCCRAAGIEHTRAHTALGDAEATAALLAYYLNPSVGVAPDPKHLQLLIEAARVPWPSIRREEHKVALRGPEHKPEPASPDSLISLLDDLPGPETVVVDASPSTWAYVAKLEEVLEDGVLTADEAAELATLAKEDSLTAVQIQQAHIGFVLELAYSAARKADGHNGRVETDQIVKMATALGLGEQVARWLLAEASVAVKEHQSLVWRTLPDDWRYGRVLRVGDRIVFSGCEPVLQARLAATAWQKGLQVTQELTGDTELLVTDHRQAVAEHVAQAGRLRVRVVSAQDLEVMLGYVEPALPTIDDPLPMGGRRETGRSGDAHGGMLAIGHPAFNIRV